MTILNRINPLTPARRRHLKTLLLLVAGVGAACLGYAANRDRYGDDYANDRAQIEDLLGRYVFAADWQDADVYASLFTEDGVLDWAGGIVRGREAIHREVIGMRANFAAQEADAAPLRPARLRHFITSLVLEVNGDTAVGRAFWVEFDNRNEQRDAYSGAYGHSEDEYRKVNGRWLFTLRKIYNEEMADRTAPMTNPAW